MKRESVKLNMDIISAFAEGKVIQYRNDITDTWSDLTEGEGLPMNTLEDKPNNFRIKPTPTYRPFANAEECWQEMLKHQPVGWVKLKNTGTYCILKVIGNNIVVGANDMPFNYERLFKEYTFADDSAFGIKEESEG